MRGQATTEAALGILAISTVIVFGIHFAEVSILSFKVQEALAAAIWDTTAKEMHDLVDVTPDLGPRQTAVGEAGPEASDRYADFDGRASWPGQTPSLVFTQASPITVTCQPALAEFPPMQVGGSAPQLVAVFPAAAEGGMACSAESLFNLAPSFTRRFMQNEPFREQHVRVEQYRVCAMSRTSGACPLTLVALGDWGLTDGPEDDDCPVTAPGVPCANTGYYRMVEAAYNANDAPEESGLELSQFLYEAGLVGTAATTLESSFFMAAVGETWSNPPGPFQMENPSGEHRGWGPYTVTPGGPYGAGVLQNYEQAHQQREPCAFGFPCDMTGWHTYQ